MSDDEPRRPRVFPPEAAAPQNDNKNKFVGKLVFFKGLADNVRYHDINNRLALIYNEEPADNDGDKEIVQAYIINNRSNARIRNLFNDPANNTLREDLNFPYILDSKTEKLSVGEESLMDLVTFLTRRDEERPFESRTGILTHHFNQYSTYACDQPHQIHEIAHHINEKENVLMIFNQFNLEKIVLKRMIERGNAKMRLASPDIIFYPNPDRRAAIAFPDDVPQWML